MNVINIIQLLIQLFVPRIVNQIIIVDILTIGCKENIGFRPPKGSNKYIFRKLIYGLSTIYAYSYETPLLKSNNKKE